MLASQPGELLADMSFDGLPRIFDSATIFLTPWFAPFIGAKASAELAEWLARVVLSYFFSPSRYVDLGDPELGGGVSSSSSSSPRFPHRRQRHEH